MPSKKVKTIVVKRLMYHQKFIITLICMCLLLSACQITPEPPVQSSGHATPTPSVEASPTPSQSSQQAITPTSTPATASIPATSINPNRPVLAFYYMWYTPSDWCSCHMSDLPTIQYTSSDDTTIARQVSWAANAGITGFISSWWGPGDKTDSNFSKLLASSATLESATGSHFASAVYIENNAPALQGTTNMVHALQYVIAHYVNDPHYFHWHGKPVIFFASPIVGNGRTLATWAFIRSQVDPLSQELWSAEGTDLSALSVFDGIHLFSAGYWGILHGDMAAVDKGFRSQIDAYNNAHHTQKIWAAGVLPGYDDTRVP